VRILCQRKRLLHHWLLWCTTAPLVPLCKHRLGTPTVLMKGVKDMFIACLLRRQTVQEGLLRDSRPLVATRASAENDQCIVNVSACTSCCNELTLYTFKSTCFQDGPSPSYYPTVLTFTVFPLALPYKAKRFFLVNLRREFQQMFDLVSGTRPVCQTNWIN
jgi:hypothetical protein